MCSESRRSVRSVAGAVGRSEATVREYKNRWKWFERLGEEGTLSARAERLYRERYYPKHKMGELVQLADKLDVPFVPDLPMAATITGSVEDMVGLKKPVEDGSSEAKTKKQQIMLVDEALSYIHSRIQSGEIKASIRDIPLLLDLRDRLGGTVHGNMSGGLPVESVRVRAARDSGGDVLEAMLQDAQELTTILGALTTKQGDILASREQA